MDEAFAVPLDSVCMFLFSGTGMTRYVAGLVKAGLERQHARCDIIDIDHSLMPAASFDTYGAIGIAYPVHSFNAPKIVIDFAGRLPRAKGQKAFIISTAGDPIGLNSASSSRLINILRGKGYDVYLDRQFVMPSNFIVKDDAEKVGKDLGRARDGAPAVAADILERGAAAADRSEPAILAEKAGYAARAAAFFGRAEWAGARLAGRLFYADSACVRCGVCADSCPSGNIAINQGRVGFGKNCGLCMRCFYICPKRSIKARGPLAFIGFDKWYDDSELSMENLRR